MFYRPDESISTEDEVRCSYILTMSIGICIDGYQKSIIAYHNKDITNTLKTHNCKIFGS